VPGHRTTTHRRNAANARKGKTRKKIPGEFKGGLDHLTNPEPPHGDDGGVTGEPTGPAPSNGIDTSPSDGPGPQGQTEAGKASLVGKLPRIDLGKPLPEVEEAVPLEPDKIPHDDAKPQRLTKEQRRVEALNYRAAGYDYREIGVALGVSVKTAHQDVQEALAYLRKYERILAEDIRALDLTRLDKMMTYLWPAIERGETYSIAQALNIMSRRAKMLGLDAPVEVDLNIRRPLAEATMDDLVSLARRLQESRPIPQATLSTSTPLVIEGEARRVDEVLRADIAAPFDQFTEETPPTPSEEP
jgi:hypothetical protein